MTSRLPRLTIRARLTLVYGGLFLAGGLLLLGVTYLLVLQQRPGGGAQTTIVAGPSADPSSPPEQSVVHGAIEATRHDTLVAVATQGGIALVAVGLLAIGSGWLIAGRLLQPLHRITDTARRIADAPAADRGLHERIALGGPQDEVRRLADTFDLMLARLDHAFDGQRQFIANASHELRTPLTLNRALLEVSLRRRTATPETRQLAETLLDITTRHEKLIEGLLLLTRSEAEILDPSYVDLADVVEHVVSATAPQPVELRADAGEAPVAGNPVLLERLVQNLVENGIRHNVASGGWVRVASGAGPDGTVTVVVSNTGPPVPRYEIPGLFEPFRRLGTDRVAGTPGAGLGLSIVRAVARAHRGDVRAEPREGGGLVVTVALPRAPCPHGAA